MITTKLAKPNESLKISGIGISWETYTHLLEDLSKQCRLRLTYCRLVITLYKFYPLDLDQ